MKTTVVPRWILVYVAFLTLLSLSTSLMGYFAPQAIFADLGIDFAQAQPITFFYATRNVGIFALGVLALWKKDGRLLLAMVFMRFVIELLDLIFTLKFGIGGFPPVVMILTWLIVFLLPEFWATYTLVMSDES